MNFQQYQQQTGEIHAFCVKLTQVIKPLLVKRSAMTGKD